MADFFQTGGMATLHRLGEPNVERLEELLRGFARTRPMALVLPCHIEELGTPALQGILRELESIDYLGQVVVGIDGADEPRWREAREFFSRSRHKPVLLWNDGPNISRVLEKLCATGLDVGGSGKGRNLWLCIGHVVASGRAKAIVSHDCDILTYDREFLARLCYPVADERLGFDFCKGYAARFGTRLNGRVMRLMFTPLVRSLESIVGPHPFLKFMDSFRYPLAGEFSADLDLVRRMGIPCDWGVEAGVLTEVYRATTPGTVCQVEVAGCFEHKHRELSPADPTKGLNKMAIDIARCVFRALAAEGVRLDAGLFDALQIAYLRHAGDTVRFYGADAAINGLDFDRGGEELAVATFSKGIRAAALEYSGNPLGSAPIPGWNQVCSVVPDILGELREVVLKDNR